MIASLRVVSTSVFVYRLINRSCISETPTVSANKPLPNTNRLKDARIWSNETYRPRVWSQLLDTACWEVWQECEEERTAKHRRSVWYSNLWFKKHIFNEFHANQMPEPATAPCSGLVADTSPGFEKTHARLTLDKMSSSSQTQHSSVCLNIHVYTCTHTEWHNKMYTLFTHQYL